MHDLNQNSYSPSRSDGIDIHITDESFIPNGRSVPAINGAKWIDQAVKMVSQQPKTWLAAMAIFVVIDLVNYSIMSSSPSFVLATRIVELMLFAGIMLAAESQRLTGKADFNLLASGFNRRIGGLVALIFILVLIFLAIVLMVVLIIGIDSISSFEQLNYAVQSGNQQLVTQSLSAIGVGNIIFAFIFGLIGLILMQMLSCFAIPLMFIKRLPFWQSLGLSFKASLKNILPAVVYFICLMIIFGIMAFVVELLPELEILVTVLSAIVIVPCSYLATYTAYQDIFNHS